jgi:hypothetical protein
MSGTAIITVTTNTLTRAQFDNIIADVTAFQASHPGLIFRVNFQYLEQGTQ